MLEYRMNFLILVLLPSVAFAGFAAKVGILSGPEDDPRQYGDKFWSLGQSHSSGVVLEPLVENVGWWEPPQVNRAVCRLLERGASSLVALGAPPSSQMLESISKSLGLPLVTGWSPSKWHVKSPFQTSLLPDTTQAIADVIKNYEWKNFAFFYDSEEGADQLQEVLGLLDLEPEVQGFWKVSNAEAAFSVINVIRETLGSPRSLRVLMATSERLANELVAKFTVPATNIHLVLLRPVGVADAFPISRQNSFLLTKLSLAENSDSQQMRVLENRWKTIMPRGRRDADLSDNVILCHDASSVLYAAYSRMERENSFAAFGPMTNRTAAGTVCNFEDFEDRKIPEDRIRLASHIKQVFVDGVTGPIKFDHEGRRTDYVLHLFESTPTYHRKIGTWSSKMGLELKEKAQPERLSDMAVSAAYQEVQPSTHVVVTSILNDPFLRTNPSNQQLEGYVVDFLDELTAVLGWKYTLHLVKDGWYGVFRDGRWNGMIGELVRQEADMAVASLTKTPERGEVIDFSKIFMTMGLSLLVKKPDPTPAEADGDRLSPFSFLSVWSHERWLLLVLAVAVFSGASWALARFNGAPERIRALTTKESDRLSPCSSLWFVAGSMALGDTGIFPRSLSHRLCSILWWTFSLFLLMMYISSLSEHLINTRTTVITTHARTAAHDLLKQFLATGSPVIGTLKGGSTEKFFLNSEIGTFRDVGRYLTEHPEDMTSSYRDGVDRVRASNGDYAFIMESVASELVSNTEPCDTLVAAGLLETRSYAVAMQKNSPLRDSVDHAILRLMETGALRRLYEKWWYNSSSSCEDPSQNILPRVYSNSLTLHEVSGVFYMLLLFAFLSVILAVVETKRKRTSLET